MNWRIALLAIGPLQTTASFSSTNKPILIKRIPNFSKGKIIPFPLSSFINGRCPRTPNMIGTLGPYISASINPTFAPPSANANAKFAETVLLPTPPFPLTTAIIFFTCAKTDFSSCLLLVVFEVKFTVTIACLLTNNLIAFSQAFFIKSFIGHAGVVNTMVKLT